MSKDSPPKTGRVPSQKIPTKSMENTSKIKVNQENHKKAYKFVPPLPSMPKHKEKTKKKTRSTLKNKEKHLNPKRPNCKP